MQEKTAGYSFEGRTGSFLSTPWHNKNNKQNKANENYKFSVFFLVTY